MIFSNSIKDWSFELIELWVFDYECALMNLSVYELDDDRKLGTDSLIY